MHWCLKFFWKSFCRTNTYCMLLYDTIDQIKNWENTSFPLLLPPPLATVLLDLTM